VDICDERDRLVVYVDLPGVLKEDIKLQVRDSSLELEATRGTPKETVLRERVNRFYRVIVLPCAVRAEEVTAKQENGVLTVTLRKVAGKAVSVE
jgi:HSP20 family protein